MTELRENRIKRLIYQSWYRGCKETDQLLGAFARRFLATADDTALDEFEAILNEQDWDLWAWVTGAQDIPEHLQRNSTLNDLLQYCQKSYAPR